MKDESSRTAFVGGRVFIGDGQILENGTVLVEGERIKEVSEGESVIPQNMRRISLDGCTLLPGFIDCHVHLLMDAGPDPIQSLLHTPDPHVILMAAEFARRTLMAGITSVRDMGGKNGFDLALRDAIQSGMIPGPRMQASGRIICMTGGHAWQIGREADGPNEVRMAAREQLKAGADLLKFMATGGVLTPGSKPGSAQLTEEELCAGIEEAHRAGRRAAAHAQGTRGILNALRAGIDTIEHGFFLNDAAISLMLEKNVTFVPTLAIYSAGSEAFDSEIPASMIEKVLNAMSAHLDSVRMAKEAGVRVAMGTDAGVPFNRHGGNLVELKQLVDIIGYSPGEALRSGTQIAAEVLGWDDKLGTIQEGKLADLVVVAGNPLEDISVLLQPENIRIVMQGGRLVRG